MPGDRKKVVELNANHSGVCKFGPSLEDQDNLKQVRGNIRYLYRKSAIRTTLLKWHQRYLFSDASSGFQARTINGLVNVEFDLLLSKVADDLKGGDGQTPLPNIAYRVHNAVLSRIFQNIQYRNQGLRD